MTYTTSNGVYELAFHITPDLEEAAMGTRTQDIESLITQNGGSITAVRIPKKIHLSYPITHKHYAFFGVVDFQSEAEALESLNAQLKLQEGVLRFLIVKKPAGKAGKELRTLGDPRIRRTRTHVAPTHTANMEQRKEQVPGDEKKIEKELEGVLEKL